MGIEVEVGFLEEDPKTTLTNQLKDKLVLVNDAGEEATAYIAYNKPPETVRELLKKYDSIITVGDPEDDDVTPIGINSNRLLHQAVYPIRVYAVDKTGITAKKMIWQMVTQVWQVIASTYNSPGGTVQHWHTIGGQAAEDYDNFKPPLLCRRIKIYVRFEEIHTT